jgi:hypothetical protein
VNIEIGVFDDCFEQFENRLNRSVIPSELRKRVKVINLPDPGSFVLDIDANALEEEILRLGGKGNVLVLLDTDSVNRSNLKNTLDRVERYIRRLILDREECDMQKIACMNEVSHAEMKNNHVDGNQMLHTLNYKCTHTTFSRFC